jgi:hypothetical protein
MTPAAHIIGISSLIKHGGHDKVKTIGLVGLLSNRTCRVAVFRSRRARLAMSDVRDLPRSIEHVTSGY